MRKQIVVVGLGRFGMSLASTLSSLGHEVLALDKDDQLVQMASSLVTHAVQADATSEPVLRELGVGNYDIAVVSIGSFIESSILATILLKRTGIPYLIARANAPLHGEILAKIGADKVIYPERDMGERVAHEVSLGSISDYIQVTPGYAMARIEAAPDIVGKSLSDLGAGAKGRLDVAVLLLQRGSEVIVTPSLSEHVRSGDMLVVSGNEDRLGEFLSRRRDR